MPVHTAGRILLAVALVMPVVGTILYSQAVLVLLHSLALIRAPSLKG
jgi:hypothetical protein